MNISAFYYALSLLSILPVPKKRFAALNDPAVRSASIVYFAVVGMILGVALCGVFFLLADVFPPLIMAGVLLFFWIFLTGAIHVDGLADCSDAFFVHHKSPEKVSAVMKDPHVGAMAVVTIVISLLLKFSALASLVSSGFNIYFALFVACLASRLTAVHYMLNTDYVIGDGVLSGLDFKHHRIMVLATSLLCFLFVAFVGGGGFALTLVTLLGFALWAWRKIWVARIGGYSGDCVGALTEITECLILILFAAFR